MSRALGDIPKVAELCLMRSHGSTVDDGSRVGLAWLHDRLTAADVRTRRAAFYAFRSFAEAGFEVASVAEACERIQVEQDPVCRLHVVAALLRIADFEEFAGPASAWVASHLVDDQDPEMSAEARLVAVELALKRSAGGWSGWDSAWSLLADDNVDVRSLKPLLRELSRRASESPEGAFARLSQVIDFANRYLSDSDAWSVHALAQTVCGGGFRWR